jgi:UDP-N-acetyl-D-mannosaminuronate dehydrogenase
MDSIFLQRVGVSTILSTVQRVLPDLVVVPTIEEALQGADAAVIATEWPVYRDLDWAAVRATMRRPLIIDGRRLLPYTQLRSMGYVVERIGDGVDGDWQSASAE